MQCVSCFLISTNLKNSVHSKKQITDYRLTYDIFSNSSTAYCIAVRRVIISAINLLTVKDSFHQNHLCTDSTASRSARCHSLQGPNYTFLLFQSRLPMGEHDITQCVVMAANYTTVHNTLSAIWWCTARPIFLSATIGWKIWFRGIATLSTILFQMLTDRVSGEDNRAFQFGQKKFRFDSILAIESIFSIRFDSAIWQNCRFYTNI